MKTCDLKLFVIPALYVTDIKDYILENCSDFSIIHLTFEYCNSLDRFRLIVEMKSEPLSFFIVSLRSEWLSAPRFSDEYANLKRYINEVEELPF